MSEFTEIGKLLKPHGVKGELKCFIEEDYVEDVLKSGLVYVAQGQSSLPYFIESIRSQNPFLIKLDTIDNKEEAVLVAHQKLPVPTKVLSRLIVEESDLEYHYLTGWDMIDQALGEIGKIDRIEEYPQQEMAFVLQGEEEHLVPLHKDLIRNIDKQSKRITVALPAGLIGMTEEE
jgi:16S rRNA processing protein RimM